MAAAATGSVHCRVTRVASSPRVASISSTAAVRVDGEFGAVRTRAIARRAAASQPACLQPRAGPGGRGAGGGRHRLGGGGGGGRGIRGSAHAGDRTQGGGIPVDVLVAEG